MSQREQGKLDRTQALLGVDATISRSAERLAAVRSREAELRAQLEAVVSERQRLEQELENAKAKLDSTARQQNQRILILTANIEHSEQELQARARAVAAIDAMLENIDHSHGGWAEAGTADRPLVRSMR